MEASGGDDVEESVVADREVRAPQLTRLGRYRLVREIASGGMASVNLAVTEGLDKLVALKLIHPHLAQEDAFVHMFLDEARIASAISHRNVCNTFDFGEADGRFYIAMDYLAGQSLRDVILRLRKTRSELEPKRLAAYMAYVLAEACEGLHAAHELRGTDGELMNVVHRDVSPHNLFVTYDGNVSVVDFGIARASDRIQHTATGVLKGKFSYMAPEQLRQLEVDRRADIWALGVVLWESLTLERLFVRSSQADTLMSVMMDRIRPPSEVRPELPPELDAIAMKALARNPQQRYATAREMGRDLMRFCRDSGAQVGAVEIEQWLERLFPNELKQSRSLVRAAKQAAIDGSALLDGSTPNGFARIPTRSGAMLKAGGSSVSMRVSQSGVALRMPDNDNDNDAAPLEVSLSEPPRPDKKKQRALIACVIALATAGGAYFAWPSAPNSTPMATPVTLTSQPTSVTSTSAAPSTPASAAIVVAPRAAASETGVAPAAIEPTSDTSTEQASPRRALPVHARVAMHAAERAPDRASRIELKTSEASRSALPSTPTAVTPDPTPNANTVEPTPPPATTPSVPSSTQGETAAVVTSALREAPSTSQSSTRSVHTQPPQVLDAVVGLGSLDVEGSLGSGVVARMLSRATPLVHTCYVDAAKRAGKNDYSALDVALTIDETGAVRSVDPASHPLNGMSRCVGDAMKRLRSERKPDVGTVHVRLKLSFRPQ